MELPEAEDINYWKSGTSQPDKWLEQAVKQIEKLEGKVVMYGFGQDPKTGNKVYMMAFEIQGQAYKVIWPILSTRSGNELAAKKQAATMLYHDIKAKCLTATVLGHQQAFFSYMLLPDGRSTSEASFEELAAGIPYLSQNTKLIKGEYEK